jgi:ribosomal protein S18 acetylase RimI-like enzyme
MSMSQPTATVLELPTTDMVSIAQCIVIDADAFPYAGVTFGFRPARAHVWAARGDDPPRVLGFAAAVVRGREHYVEALAVERGFRRRGIGRALLGAAMAHAREARLEAVRLHVWVGNRAAVELYLSTDFVVLRRRPNFYRAGVFAGSDDAYEMRWRVDGER